MESDDFGNSAGPEIRLLQRARARGRVDKSIDRVEVDPAIEYQLDHYDLKNGEKKMVGGYNNVVAPGAATVTTAQLTKAVYCGVAGDYDFYIKGTWVLLKGMLAGQIYPIACTGARDGDDTDVEAGDLMFLY